MMNNMEQINLNIPSETKTEFGSLRQKQRNQVKSKFYYIFWGVATVSVVLGQLYVGSGYRVFANSLLRIFDAIEVEVGRDFNNERFY